MDRNTLIKNPDTGNMIKLRQALHRDPNSAVYKAAKQMIDGAHLEDKPKDTTTPEVATTKEPSKKKKEKNARSHKPKADKVGVNKDIVAKYGKYKLNAFPPSTVDEKDVKVDLDGDINKHAVLQWKDPKSGRTVRSYTRQFLADNAKIKWARVKKIKPNFVENLKEDTLKSLNNKDPKIADSAAIINIIANTGLRPGSEKGLGKTGNKGVSTMGPENIKIDGDKITINFIGKSYQENNAVIENEELANYLKKRLEERKGEKLLFDVDKNDVSKAFHKMTGDKKIKIKDLRTFTATKMAGDILKNDKTPPPPLPEKAKDIKKAVKNKLKMVFEKVSQKLNNTPGMAKSSYVHPNIISAWLDSIGVEPALLENYTLFNFFNIITEVKNDEPFDYDDLEECDEYPLPSWWDDDDAELKKV